LETGKSIKRGAGKLLSYNGILVNAVFIKMRQLYV
jgi:hypothetical protein